MLLSRRNNWLGVGHDEYSLGVFISQLNFVVAKGVVVVVVS